MCASSIDHRAHRPGSQRGFTLGELVGVLLLVAALAVVALPRLEGALAWQGDAWREQVVGALRHARATAQGHRRLVCATVATGAVTLAIAAAHPSNACTAALVGPDGQAAFAHEASGVATSVAPAGTLYFQPSGRITSDGAGTTALNATIAIAGESGITVTGETGHVE